MAYMNQERKAQRAGKIKDICKRYGVKGSLSVRHHSTLVLTVSQGKIDFLESFNRLGSQELRPDHLPFRPAEKCIDVNVYHYERHFDGRALEFLQEVIPAMYGDDYFDETDSQIDYFHCSHYIDVNIGKWNKPYALVK